MGELAEKYSDEIYATLAKAAIEAQKPLTGLYIRVCNGSGYIGPNNTALFKSPDIMVSQKIRILTVKALLQTLFEDTFEDVEGDYAPLLNSHKIFLGELENRANRLTVEEVEKDLKLKSGELEKLIKENILKS